MPIKFRIITTPAGHVGIVASSRGLRRVYLPERSQGALRRRIGADFEGAGESNALLPDLAGALARYFAGQRIQFKARLDTSQAGEFERAVWRACQQVRYGKTTSYAELARRAGRPGAARAVGGAMSHNPFPIVVPCHRVLRSDGGLGGYSAPGGVAYKKRLLAIEAAPH